eukprot:14639985-Alexandrium_andersonii.AAC.1
MPVSWHTARPRSAPYVCRLWACTGTARRCRGARRASPAQMLRATRVHGKRAQNSERARIRRAEL